MTPKPEHDRDAVILARVLREREWCYAGWLAHKTWTQLRVEAARPESEGGLGYDLSIQAIKGLVEAARADRGDLHLDRDAHIERELHDLDVAQQLALSSLKKAASIGALDVHAAKLYAELGRDRRKLLGLDAATKIEAEVTHRDAVTEELNAMLARAGREPIEGKTQP
jgi:hypothetical protein